MELKQPAVTPNSRSFPIVIITSLTSTIGPTCSSGSLSKRNREIRAQKNKSILIRVIRGYRFKHERSKIIGWNTERRVRSYVGCEAQGLESGRAAFCRLGNL